LTDSSLLLAAIKPPHVSTKVKDPDIYQNSSDRLYFQHSLGSLFQIDFPMSPFHFLKLSWFFKCLSQLRI